MIYKASGIYKIENEVQNKKFDNLELSLNNDFVLRYTASPRSLDPFHIPSYYIKWVKTLWTDGTIVWRNMVQSVQ